MGWPHIWSKTSGRRASSATRCQRTSVCRNLNVAASRIAWDALRGCRVYDALAECGGKPVLWALGPRLTVGASERVEPFLGVSLGLYRRTWQTNLNPRGLRYLDQPDRRSSPSVVLSAGLDIRLVSAVVFRLKLTHQEVLDSTVQEYYKFFAGHRLRFTGISAGLGLAFR